MSAAAGMLAFICLALLILVFVIFILVVLIEDCRGNCGRSHKSCKCSKKTDCKIPCTKVGLKDYASFTATMGCLLDSVNDNPNPLAGGDAVQFPTLYAASGSDDIILNTNPSFNGAILLKKPGVYSIGYTVPLAAPGGQLALVLQDSDSIQPIEQANTVIGTPGTGGETLSGEFQLIIEKANVNLTVRNPVNSVNPIQVQSCAGTSADIAGTAWLTIEYISQST